MLQLTPSQIGLVSWSLKDLASPLDMPARLKQLNMSKVQLALHALVTDPDPWCQVPDLLAAADIAIVSGMWSIRGGVIDDEQWADNVTMTQAVGEIAQPLGVRLMTSHIGHLPDEQDPQYAVAIERTKTLAEILEQSGCRFLFETGPESSPRLCRFLEALAQAGSPKIGINFDPGNMLIYNTDDPTVAMRRFLPWIEQCHLKDARRPDEGQPRGPETPVGQGEVDWTAFLTMLAEIDYAGDLIIEREKTETLDQDVADAVEHITQLMQAVAPAAI